MAWSRVVPRGAVMRRSLVITSETLRFIRVSNRKSRLVRMPTSFWPLMTGTPEMRYFFIKSRASDIFASGVMVMGSMIMPLSDFFTLSTSSACRSMGRALWMKPSPPSWARAMASLASVTVSMAALTRGRFRMIFS